MFCIIGFEDLEYFNLTLIQNDASKGVSIDSDLEYFNKSSFNATAYFEAKE